MKFLPMKEFQKRQKSINSYQTRAIMNAMMKKIGVFINASSTLSDWLLKLNHLIIPIKDNRGHREEEKSNEVERNRKFYYEGRGL